MMLLSLHLTDLNQRKEIERLRFVFRWTNFQHVLLFVANWRLVEISAALEPERCYIIK